MGNRTSHVATTESTECVDIMDPLLADAEGTTGYVGESYLLSVMGNQRVHPDTLTMDTVNTQSDNSRTHPHIEAEGSELAYDENMLEFVEDTFSFSDLNVLMGTTDGEVDPTKDESLYATEGCSESPVEVTESGPDPVTTINAAMAAVEDMELNQNETANMQETDFTDDRSPVSSEDLPDQSILQSTLATEVRRTGPQLFPFWNLFYQQKDYYYYYYYHYYYYY